MTAYKALYKKMSDDLKDAEMWLDWAHHMKDDKDHEELVKYLVISAKTRAETDFPTSFKMFEDICQKDKDGMCLCETVADHLENWQEDLIRRIQKWS